MVSSHHGSPTLKLPKHHLRSRQKDLLRLATVFRALPYHLARQPTEMGWLPFARLGFLLFLRVNLSGGYVVQHDTHRPSVF